MDMTKEEWEEYYNRWSEKFRKLDNREAIIDRVIAKYGNRRSVTDVMIFDVLYEYASRYGESTKKDESDDDFNDELLISSYKVDNHEIGLVYVENPFIWIW